MASSAHAQLADMYRSLGRNSDAQEQFELAVSTERDPALQEFRQAHMLIVLRKRNRNNLLEAKAHLEKALEIQPQLIPARQLLRYVDGVLGEK